MRFRLTGALMGIAFLLSGAVAVASAARRPERLGYYAQVFVLSRDGGRVLRLTHGHHEHGSPVWAPGSHRLAILEDRRVDVITRTGALLQRFGPYSAGVAPAAWSPDAERIAFVAFRGSRDKANGQLVVASVDTGAVRVVARHAAGRVAWSRDGRRLYYLHAPNVFQGRPERAGEIYETTPSGRRRAKLASRASEFGGLSPYGRWLAFTRRVPGSSELWAAHRDGSAPRRLLTSAGLNYSWAPGRLGVLVWSDYEGRQHPLVVTPAGDRRRLGASIPTTRALAWSPDARLLAWEKEPLVGPTTVRTAHPDGAGIRTVGRFAARSYVEIDSLAWSPDGRWLAVAPYRGEE